MRRLLIIFSVLLYSAGAFAQEDFDKEYDSLKAVFYSMSDSDTAKISVCRDIASGLNNLDSTLVWADRLVDIASRNGDLLNVANGYFYKGWALYYLREHTSSIDACFKSLLLADSLNYAPLRFKNNLMIGHNYFSMKDYMDCDEFYFQALEQARIESDTSKICQCMRFLADAYTNKSMYGKAREMYQQTYAIDSACGNYEDMRRDYHGIVYILMAQYFDKFTDQDISLIHKAKEYIGIINGIETSSVYSKYSVLKAYFHVMLAELRYYDYQGQRRAEVLDTMLNILNDAETYSGSIDLGPLSLYDDLQKADYMTACRRFPEAKRIMDSLQMLVDSDSASYYMLQPDLNLARDYYYKSTGRMDSAYYYITKYFEHQIASLSPDYAVKSTQDWERAKFNDVLRQREIRAERRKRVIFLVLAGIALLVFFFVADYLRKRRHNTVLNEKNLELVQQKEEITTQNDLISQKNTQITASLNYASLIQQAVMPKDAYLKSMFTDYFLIYKPLAIVAGDFYWANQIGKYNIMVCADCTGHGVPGAFVSMLGISLLNDIVPMMVFQESCAANILNELKDRLMYSLGQSRKLYDEGALQNNDGMDLSLIMIDSDTSRLQYAGANRPLWIFSGGQLTTIKPDRMPIGLYLGQERSFTNHEIDVRSGDVIYMFSDGIIDQFGFTNDAHTEYKRFSTKRFSDLVSEIGAEPLAVQKQKIEQALADWQNGHPQSDDIIVMGIQI